MKWKFHKTGKSLLVFLLSAVIILSMIPAVAVHAETVTVQYDVSEFKGDKDSSEWTYPSQDGKVFAGWFTDETYETAYTGTKGTAHARFVDETIMQVKLQCNSTADAKDETIHIRFLTAIKDTMLKSVTFHVAVTELGKSWDWVEKTAYKSVLEDGATAASNASTSFGSTDATYFVVHTLKNIPKSVYSKSFTATVSWKTLDGTTVTGITREFKPDGLDELLLTLPDTATRAFGSGITKTTDDSGVTLTVNNGSESGGLFEIGEPRYNASSWEVGALIGATEDVVIRKGVGVVTPQGSLLLYVSNEVAGYVTWDTLVDKDDNSIRSAALPISDKVKDIIAQGNYTLKAIATDIDGAGTGKINLYVNDIWVYTFVNNHVAKSNGTVSATPLDLSAKILPSIGAYYDQNVGVSFSDWYYRIEAEQVKEVGTVSGTFAKLDGTALPDTVTITFGSESFGNISRTVTIGDNKDFEILLPVGDYTVDVAADGYQGGCAPITVKTGANDIGIVRLLQEMTEVVLWFESGTKEQSGNSVTLGVPADNANHGVEWQIGKDITGATSWTVSAHIAPGALDQHGFTVGTADGGSGALFLFVNADKAGHYSWQTFVQKETGSEFWKYWSLSDEAKAAMASEDGYTLTLEATGMDGKLSGVLSLYVNDIKVYSVANTFVGISSDHGCEDVWMDLQNCHLSLAVRSDPGDTTGGATYASATFSDWYYTYSTEPSDTEDTEDTDNTEGWTIMPLRDSIKEWINVNGSLTSTESGAVLSTTVDGGADNQLLCQFADAGENITAFQISTKVQPGAMARRGVGFRTPYGYMFFNVIEESGDTGVGYVAFNTDGNFKEQNYQELDVVAGQFITGTTKAYTLKLVAKDLTGTENDKIYFYVNNILVYTYTNTLEWDLTEQVRPAIGVRNISASATFTDYTFKVLCDEDNTKEAPDTANWTEVDLITINGFINNNGDPTWPSEIGGAATFATKEGNAANQLLCQFANAAENISAFEISTKVQSGAEARRGVGFKTPDGYIFFNVVENSNTNGAGYVWYNIKYEQQTQDYVVLKEAAEEVVTGADPYTLKLVATDLTGTSADTITLYVNDIAVYTYTNTLGWDLTKKVLPAIGVRGSGASAIFTDYTFKVLPKTVNLTLAYDDRYTFEAAVASNEVVSVTSNQTGMQTPDTAVLTASGDGNTYIATGVGTAKVTLANGIVYNVTVEPATISVALIAGQSNAEGWGTEAKRKLSIACPDGQVYSTYGFSNTDFASINGITATSSDALSVATAPNFVATSLTSNVSYSDAELLYPLNSMTESGIGKVGIDSGLAYQWNKLTGEKIWVVNCAHGGSSITTWVPGRTNYEECIALMSYVQQTMEAEIAAGHYELSKFMYFWCQGEADNSWIDQADYYENLKLVHNGLKTDLTLNGQTLDYGGNIIVYANGENSGELDIADTGVRLAQKQACAETTGDFADFYMACDVNEQWVTDTGVAEYWETRYPNSAYPFTLQEGSYTNPTTVAQVEGDKIHYMAPAYNEIGIVCADSAYETLFGD